MDSLTILGILFALLAIFGGQFLEGGSIESLLNFPAFVIVIGGTIGAALLQSSLATLRRAIKMLRWGLVVPKINQVGGVEKLVRWSVTARKHGLLGLEKLIDTETVEFDRNGLMLLVDGSEPESIRNAMMIELEVTERESLKAVKFYESLGGYAPTLGIVGAVLGLIQVMGNLSEPALLGSGIATAFVATIYGVGSANLFFLPIANKLKTVVHAYSLHREMMVEGLVLIAEGENPKVIESRLAGYIPKPS